MSSVTPAPGPAPGPSLVDALPAPLAPPSGCTHFQLRQLVRRVGLLYDAELAAVGLKTTQYSLLSAVLKLGPLRPGDLARVLQMQPSTLTRNLKPLVEAGWLAVSAGTDGRSRAVAITPAGRALRAQAQRRWRLAQDRLNLILGEQRVAALHALIQESLPLLADPGPETDDE